MSDNLIPLQTEGDGSALGFALEDICQELRLAGAESLDIEVRMPVVTSDDPRNLPPTLIVRGTSPEAPWKKMLRERDASTER